MVNRGHRSLGCAPCRLSKVKCDQQRPACGRCVRSARICSGYRTEERVLLQRPDGSQLLRERLETWRPKTNRAVSEPVIAKSRRPMGLRKPVVPLSPGSDMKISTDWTDCSVALFMCEYVEGPDYLQTMWGHYEYLPDLLLKGRSTYLTHAVHAAALVNAANTSSVMELERLARHEYGKALQGLGNAMNDPELMLMDETLATMNVLSTYEIIAGQRPLSSVWHAHLFGQSTFLHHRQHDKEPTSCSLFGITNLLLMWRDLVCCSGPYMCVQKWPPSTYRSSLGDASARLTLRIVEICGRVRKLVETPTQQSIASETKAKAETFAALARDAVDLDLDLHTYFESASDTLQPWTLSHRFRGYALDARSSIQSISNRVSAIPGRGVAGGSHLRSRPVGALDIRSYPSRIDVYPSKGVSFLWGALRVAWIHMSRSMIDLRLFAEDRGYSTDNLPSFEATYMVITELVEGVCAAVPYSLGDVDQNGKLDTGNCTRSSCFHIIWLLHRLCDIPGLDPSLRAWIVSVFERIGHRGVRRGHFLADLHRD